MSDRPRAPMPAAHASPTATRAARLARFQREQLIVDFLNRGVSVVEIAARVGLSEKRTRAVIRETVARRMPHPPEPPDPSPGVVAIQVSRLNEALLVAFSAMSPSNLKGVDQVVKIVRELDRYGGAFAAEWARPEAPPIRRPGARTSKDASLNVNLAPARDRRPQNLAQRLEKVQSAPGIASAPMAGADAGPSIANVAARWTRPRAATDCVARPPEGQGFAAAGSSGDSRPENPPQRLENVQSAPGTASAAMARADAGPSIANVAAHGTRPRNATDSVARPPEGLGFPAAGSSGDARPENPSQRLEKVESAPGIASAAMAGADAGLSIANAAARWTRSLEQAHGVAAQPRARGFRPPPRRPTLARKIRRNALKRLNPRPREAALGGGSSPARRSPSRIGPRSVRATLGSAMAC